MVGGGLGREFLLRLAQGLGFLGAEALQLGGDAFLDPELEGLEAGDIGLGGSVSAGWAGDLAMPAGEVSVSDLVAGLEGLD